MPPLSAMLVTSKVPSRSKRGPPHHGWNLKESKLSKEPGSGLPPTADTQTANLNAPLPGNGLP